ncbi:hypothetical protein [Streptomyces sp. NPDC088736]
MQTSSLRKGENIGLSTVPAVLAGCVKRLNTVPVDAFVTWLRH